MQLTLPLLCLVALASSQPITSPSADISIPTSDTYLQIRADNRVPIPRRGPSEHTHGFLDAEKHTRFYPATEKQEAGIAKSVHAVQALLAAEKELKGGKTAPAPAPAPAPAMGKATETATAADDDDLAVGHATR